MISIALSGSRLSISANSKDVGEKICALNMQRDVHVIFDGAGPNAEWNIHEFLNDFKKPVFVDASNYGNNAIELHRDFVFYNHGYHSIQVFGTARSPSGEISEIKSNLIRYFVDPDWVREIVDTSVPIGYKKWWEFWK